jgi:hypothetical protein
VVGRIAIIRSDQTRNLQADDTYDTIREGNFSFATAVNTWQIPLCCKPTGKLLWNMSKTTPNPNTERQLKSSSQLTLGGRFAERNLNNMRHFCRHSQFGLRAYQIELDAYLKNPKCGPISMNEAARVPTFQSEALTE